MANSVMRRVMFSALVGDEVNIEKASVKQPSSHNLYLRAARFHDPQDSREYYQSNAWVDVEKLTHC